MIFLDIHGEQMCCSWFAVTKHRQLCRPIYHAYYFTVFY